MTIVLPSDVNSYWENVDPLQYYAQTMHIFLLLFTHNCVGFKFIIFTTKYNQVHTDVPYPISAYWNWGSFCCGVEFYAPSSLNQGSTFRLGCLWIRSDYRYIMFSNLRSQRKLKLKYHTRSILLQPKRVNLNSLPDCFSIKIRVIFK